MLRPFVCFVCLFVCLNAFWLVPASSFYVCSSAYMHKWHVVSWSNVGNHITIGFYLTFSSEIQTSNVSGSPWLCPFMEKFKQQ
jgi:hypothetical protein